MKNINWKNHIKNTILFCIFVVPVVLFSAYHLGNSIQNTSPALERDFFRSRTSVYLPVLIYHHFAEAGPVENGMIVSKSSFDDQMKGLKEEGYTAVTLDQILDYVDCGKRLPEKPVLITIDDGYTSNLEIAAPILEKYEMHAVIFVIGIYAGETIDIRSGNLIYPSRFSWEDAQAWVEKGVLDIQSHTYDMHRIVSDGCAIRDGMLRAEGESLNEYRYALKYDFDYFRDLLDENLGVEMNAIAFPYGYVTDELLEETKNNGVRLSFSTIVDGNYITPLGYEDLQMMNRINVYDNTTGEDLVYFIEEYNVLSE